jgi:hypothetical protein
VPLLAPRGPSERFSPARRAAFDGCQRRSTDWQGGERRPAGPVFLPVNGPPISSKVALWPNIGDYCEIVRTHTKQEENSMSVIAGFDKLDSVAEEQMTEKIGRRVISGKQGTMVYGE